MIKIVRKIFNLLILLAFIFFGYCYFTKNGIFSQTKIDNTEVAIGGDFSLINQDGQVVHSNDLKDKYKLIFFGFSLCKRICPMHLGIISEALAKLDNNIHKKLQAIFITIDPERDSIKKLKEFHQQFDDRIQMLTGTREEIDQVILKYKVYASKVAGEEEINHSSVIYLIGPDGKYVTHFALNLDSSENQSDKIVAGLKRYVN
ncbi:photosynthetic protein synthase II [Wolbachia pipientis]|uniref:Photosynthetic protein synthase II n=1 Tax=Wolbachia pipientis TaxID=955 RepID=A0A1E7QJT4_WOLPI|nr:SCO family protein [Wolbachia pipientis]OEY86742.1 photosynthetic protein synthase II [Wolbachia pipientis]